MKAKWGTARVQGERTICVREDENKAVFISRGGLVECLYWRELRIRIRPTPMPDVRTLSVWFSGLSERELDELAAFCAEPKTMDEIDGSCEAAAYWLRRIGLLRDVGRNGRKIVSVWSGFRMEPLLAEIFGEADRHTEKLLKMYGGKVPSNL